MALEFSTPLEPSTYFIDPDGDASTPLRVVYEVPAAGWSQWMGTVKFSDVGHVAVSITSSEPNAHGIVHTATGQSCFLCGAELHDPAVFWNGETADIYLHPACVVDLAVRGLDQLPEDVVEAFLREVVLLLRHPLLQAEVGLDHEPGHVSLLDQSARPGDEGLSALLPATTHSTPGPRRDAAGAGSPAVGARLTCSPTPRRRRASGR